MIQSSLPEFNFTTQFMGELRAAIINHEPRYPEGRNRFIDLQNINSTKSVARDEDDPELEIRISRRTITPLLRVRHPLTGNTDRRPLQTAKIPVNRHWRNERNWKTLLEAEKTKIRTANLETAPGDVKDQIALAAFKKETLSEVYNYYKSREAFTRLKASTQEAIEYVVGYRFLNYICGRFTFGEMPADTISINEAQMWLDSILDGTARYKNVDPRTGKTKIVSHRPSRAMAINARSYASRMFGVLDGRRVSRNPISKTEKIDACPPRSRSQSPEQIKRIWRATEILSNHEQLYVRFLLLTAQRREQVACLEWSWINFEAQLICFPPIVVKGKKRTTSPFEMPISSQVMEILNERKQHLNGKLVFGTSNNTPISNFSRIAAKLDAKILGEQFNWKQQRRKSSCFTFHDFRRTASMLIQNADETVRPFHTKILIAHKITDGGAIDSYWHSENEMIETKRKLFRILGEEILRCVS